MSKKVKCPVCGEFEFKERDSHEVCPVCGWENDWVDSVTPDDCFCNEYPLDEYKRLYEAGEYELLGIDE